MGGGALLFPLSFTNWKSGRRAITGKISTPGVLISELADYLIYLSCSRKGMPLLYIKTVLLYWHQVLMKKGPLNVVKVAL